jgi:hypothetical protein
VGHGDTEKKAVSIACGALVSWVATLVVLQEMMLESQGESSHGHKAVAIFATVAIVDPVMSGKPPVGSFVVEGLEELFQHLMDSGYWSLLLAQ